MPQQGSSRKRQAQLSFSPLPSSSPASKGYHEQIRNRAAAVTVDASPSPAKRRRIDLTAQAAVTHTSETITCADNASSSADELSTVLKTSRIRSSKPSTSRFRQGSLVFDNVRDPSSFDTPIKVQPHKTSSHTQAGMFSSQARYTRSSSDGSDDGSQLPSPARSVTSPKKPKKAKSSRASNRSKKASRPKKTQLSPEKVVVSDDADSDDVVTSSYRDRRRQKMNAQATSDSDDDTIMAKNAAGKKPSEVADEMDDSEDEVKTPGRRRVKRPRRLSRQEEDELADDLKYIGPSSDVEMAAQPSRTASNRKNARLQALESLKRKRAGLPETVEEEQEEQEEMDHGGNDEDDEDDEVDEVDEDDDGDTVPFPSSRSMFQEDSDDAEFLSEGDVDNILGVPEGVPIKFTRYGTMKPKELFKFAVEWSVQKSINPGFPGNDEIYVLTFDKLESEVAGLASSKFKSAAWTAEFTFALDARPDIAIERFDREAPEHFMRRDKCDACNRSSHPATYQIQFLGKPYDRKTLEDIASNRDSEESNTDSSSSSSSSDSDSDEAEKEAYDSQGRRIVPEAKLFYVGKFCKANAQTAHNLRHWKYHLNQEICTWLNAKGYHSSKRLAKRAKWDSKKRFDYANKLVRRMEKAGEVGRFWNSFKASIDQARNSTQGRFRGSSP